MRVLLALVLAVVFMLPLAPSPVSAEQGCIISAAGVKVCGELLNQPLPEVVEVTVTVKPDPIRIPGPTVTVQPPQATVTVPGQPGATKTVPGPTTTVTLPPQPGPTGQATITMTPRPAQSVGPYTRAPETRFAQPTEPGQMGPRRGTMVDEKDTGFFSPDINFGDDEVTAGEVGLGTLTLLALVGLILLAMYAGYVLGYKDKERDDTDFMRALLDGVKTYRGKHS